jgi:hypothetical protein
VHAGLTNYLRNINVIVVSHQGINWPGCLLRSNLFSIIATCGSFALRLSLCIFLNRRGENLMRESLIRLKNFRHHVFMISWGSMNELDNLGSLLIYMSIIVVFIFDFDSGSLEATQIHPGSAGLFMN